MHFNTDGLICGLNVILLKSRSMMVPWITTLSQLHNLNILDSHIYKEGNQVVDKLAHRKGFICRRQNGGGRLNIFVVK